MNNMIWIIVAMKLFVICWLIYTLLERRKRKRGQQQQQEQNVVIIEEGPIAMYAGAPVTQMPKDCQEYYSEELYASVNNTKATTKGSHSASSAVNTSPQQHFFSSQTQVMVTSN